MARSCIRLLCVLLIPHTAYSLVLGIENYQDSFFKTAKDKEQSFIIITNQTGITQSSQRSVDILRKQNIAIRFIAAPEHGLAGTVQAGQDVQHLIDEKTDLPVLSLYKGGSGLLIDPDKVASCDGFCFDIQDCGMRHYTFISTLYKTLQMALTYDKEIIVFDRPNFLGPIVAGPLVDPALLSFISIASIPMRYGLTIGELAHYFNRYFFDSKIRLHVVPMRDYLAEKVDAYPFTAPLSPNINSLQACYGYSFLGILGEVRPFDLGVGTHQAFTILMLPQSLGITPAQWDTLSATLRKHSIRCEKYSYYSERKKAFFEGLSLFIRDVTKVPSFIVVLEILRWALDCSINVQYSPSFDKAIGTTRVRELYQKRDYNGLKSLLGAIQGSCTQFIMQAQPCLLYKQKLISI